MATTPTQPTSQSRFQDSSWITLLWEWFKMLLGRAADPVLWITMLFSAYQLIPGAPQPPAGVSTTMFIMQFVALDIGGLGMLQLADQHHLSNQAFAKRMAFGLIGTTLITVLYAGLGNALTKRGNPIPVGINTSIEVLLVIIRCVLTVLYAPAINSLKNLEKQADQHLQDLENEVVTLRREAKAKEQEVTNVQSQLAQAQKAASSLQIQLSNEREAARVATESLQGKLDARVQEIDLMSADQAGIIALKRELNTAKLQAEDLQIQLENKQRALASEQLLCSNLRKEVERFQQNETLQLQSGTPPVERWNGRVERQSGTSRLVSLPAKPARMEPDTGEQKAIAGTAESAEQANAKTAVYRLLDSNNRLQVADIVATTGLPKTTVWRHWQRYHKEHGTLVQVPGEYVS
jgi:hypothetical protein